MSVDSRFFARTSVKTIGELVTCLPESLKSLLELADTPLPEFEVAHVAPLHAAGKHDISFFENPAYLEQFKNSTAGLIITHPKFAKHKEGGHLLLTKAAYQTYAAFATTLYTSSTPTTPSISTRAFIHDTAQIAENCTIEAGAFIGAGVEIGRNVFIGANSVIRENCAIGHNTYIAAGVTISHAFIGDKVIIHPGVSIGQDGFGFAMSGSGHLKVPPLGRVIIQDHVEIGANTAIDRGTIADTVIGEGSKIDNLNQIGHNVQIGRHCVIAGQCAIAGSVILEDFVVMGGQTCIAGHITLGKACQLAGGSALMHNIPAGEKWGGNPAQSFRQYFREVAALRKLAQKN